LRASILASTFLGFVLSANFARATDLPVGSDSGVNTAGDPNYKAGAFTSFPIQSPAQFGLVRFAGIPTSPVTSAKLRLTVLSVFKEGPISAYAITSDWKEATVRVRRLPSEFLKCLPSIMPASMVLPHCTASRLVGKVAVLVGNPCILTWT